MKASKRHLYLVADHAVNSMSNVLLIFAMARSLSPSDFGVFSLGYSAVVFLTTVSRAGLVTFVSLGSSEGDTSVRRASGRSLGIIVTAWPLLAAFVWLIALVPSDGWPRSILLLAIATPLVLIQDCLRYTAITLRRPGLSLASSVLWLGIFLTALIPSWSGHSPLWNWALGAAAAALLIMMSCRILPRWDHWREMLGYRRRLRLASAASAALSTGSLTVTLIVAGAIVDPTAIAALAGATTLMGPINILISSLVNGTMADAARLTTAEARRRHFRRGAAVLALTALAWGALVSLVPDPVGRMLLGETWSVTAVVLPLVALQYVLAAVAEPGTAALIANGQTRALGLVRGLTAVLRVALAAVGATVWGTASGVALGQVLATAVGALMVWGIHHGEGSR